MLRHQSLDEPSKAETIIIKALERGVTENDVAHLEAQLLGIHINTRLNEKLETALMIAIKHTHLHLVQMLISNNECDLTIQNINNYSVFDIAVITAFDSRQGPRHNVCWEIVSLLLRAGAEPACPEAMLYVFRTALKAFLGCGILLDDCITHLVEDVVFLRHFITACIDHCTSCLVHERVLLKLHRNQPLYMAETGIDQFLELASMFTVKLIKRTIWSELPRLIQTFVYYLESHWCQRKLKEKVYQRLVLYASAAGWQWTSGDLILINSTSQALAHWCQRTQCSPCSLSFASRLSFRRKCRQSVPFCLSLIGIPDVLKEYVLLGDLDVLLKNEKEIDLSKVQM